jgi:rhodanese/phosphatase family protein
MFRITRVLSVGRFATPERAEELRAAGVTHVLNVAEAPCSIRASTHGFREVEWMPLEDHAPLPAQKLVKLLDTVHGMAIEPDSHVYVHCMGGQLRSPTTLWLYLVACGVSPMDAREWIEDRSPDASPGSTRMVNDALVRFAEQHGLANYRPHPRAETIVPFE